MEQKSTSGRETLTRRSITGGLWLTSSTALTSILKVAVLSVLARLLSPSDFGLIAAAFVVVAFAEMFSMLGVGSALVQIRELSLRHVRTGFTLTVLFGLALGLLVLLLSPLIANLFRMPDLGPVLRLLVWLFPLKAIADISNKLLQRKLLYRKLAGVDVVSYLLGYASVGILLAWNGFGVWSLVWALLAQAALQSAILLVIQPHSVRPDFHVASAKDLLKLGTGFTMASVFNFFALRGDNFVVGRWLGPSALGVYGQAYNLMNTPNVLFGSVLNIVLFPAFSKIQSEQDRLRHAYRRGSSTIAALMIPTSISAIILAPEVVLVLLGSQWQDVVFPFQILAAGMLFRLSYKLSGTLARGCGEVYALSWRQMVYAVAVVAGAIVGKQWGVNGVALFTLIALGVIFILLTNLSLRITAMRPSELWSLYRPALVLGLVTGVAALLVATSLRSVGVAPIVVLVGTIASAASIAVLSSRVAPSLFLGDDLMSLLRAAPFTGSRLQRPSNA